MAEVLTANLPADAQSFFQSSHIHRSSSTPNSLYRSSSASRLPSRPPSIRDDDQSTDSINYSTSISSQTSYSDLNSSTASECPTSNAFTRNIFDDSEELSFPNYGENSNYPHNLKTQDRPRPGYLSDPAPSPTRDYVPWTPSYPFGASEDDSVIRAQPYEQVDYYTYEWREDDLWATWKHLAGHRGAYLQWSRLENAAWRIWARYAFKRNRIAPESINWYVYAY